MTDPQLPPPGAVPPPPPAPQPSYGQPPAAPQPSYGQSPPAPPAYPSSPPAPPTYSAPAPAPAPAYPAAPPGAYQVPVGGYSAPAGQYQVPPVDEKKSSLLGMLALVAALLAAVVMPIIGGVAGFQIGTLIPGGIDTSDEDFLSVLSPARSQVLWAEIAFWAGTILGIAAIVVGIIAIRKKQGRGLGIAAVVVAVIGPVIFWLAVLILISVGTAAGFLP